VRKLLAGILVCASLSMAQAEEYALLPALPVTAPTDMQLLDITGAGERLVAVGERGAIIYSDDQGRSWEQARVPVSETLTSIVFPTPEHGWAVGHGGVILHSGDAGETWQLQFDGNDANRQKLDFFKDRVDNLEATLREAEEEPAEELQYALEDAQYALEDAELAIESGPADPFLDVWFADEARGFAVGAYGMLYRTDNGGLQWRISVAGIENREGYHYYSMSAADDGTLYLAGEVGILYRSDDGGKNWQRLDLGYEGSLFGVIALPEDRAVAFGLRGNIFTSNDRGETWVNATPEDSPGLSYYGGGRLRGGGVVLAGAGGVMTSSRDLDQFTTDIHSARNTFSSVIALEGDILLVGMGGLTRIAAARGGFE
jgi:photosystem II stability/assembly factor-like uncharacterized protein